MTTKLEWLISRLLDREGGVKDVGDGKGVTRFGQTPAWLARFGLPIPTNRDEAAANYLAWLGAVDLASIVAPGDDLADIVLDIAVMSGEDRAVRALQTILGVDVDGVVGPKTLAALAAANRDRLAKHVIAWDMRFKGRLISLDHTKAQFAGGWLNRLAEHVERLT